MQPTKTRTTKATKYHEGFCSRAFLRVPSWPLWLMVSQIGPTTISLAIVADCRSKDGRGNSKMLARRGGRVPGLSPLGECSDRFITIQTISMDASRNRVQDRTHDFVPQRLPRVEVGPKRR